MIRLLIIGMVAVLAACGDRHGQGTAASRTAEGATQGRAPAVVVAHRPPTSKDIVDAVLASTSVPLSVSPTCQNVGTEPTDRTIGRYLAGFMAEMSRSGPSNWIETASEPGQGANAEPVWICRMTLRHVDGDDRWGWGVMFHVRQRDGVVLDDSFTCTGAG